MAEDIQEPTSRVSPLRPSRQSIIASRVELIDIEYETTSNLSNMRENAIKGQGQCTYTTLLRLGKIYNFSRLDLGIGMRPDFPDFIIPFLWPILPTRNPSATGGTETTSRLES